MKRACCKNRAVVLLYLADLEPRESTRRECFFRSAEAFTAALYWAAQLPTGDDDDAAWIDGVRARVADLCGKFDAFAGKQLGIHERLRDAEVLLQKLTGGGGDLDTFLGHRWLALAELRIARAMELLRADDFAAALVHLKELYRPVEEVKRVDRKNTVLAAEGRVMEAEMHSQTFIAEALQALKVGRDFLEAAIDMQMMRKPLRAVHDKAFEALDKLREAGVLAREQDVDAICQVLAQIGRALLVVFGQKFAAKQLFKEVFELCKTLSGNMYARHWYGGAVGLSVRIQSMERTEEETKWENRRKPFMEELRADLKLLDDNCRK